jgi:hypothetical protein
MLGVKGGVAMSNAEIFSSYLLPVIVALLTAVAGFIGTQLKSLYQKYVNDKTKEAVVRTCVKAAEQLYHDLSGAEKLKKAQDGIVEMLNEKGIPISELELNLLIESVVAEFNYGFGVKDKGKVKEPEPEPVVEEPENESELVYSEEGGSR